MHDVADWSLGLGRWRGIPLRVHALFLIMALIVLFLGAREDDGLVETGLAVLAILLVSVVFHELGHIVAGLRLGGRVDQIVLGPFGGLTQVSLPSRLRQEWIAAAAGPAVNLFLAVFLLGVVALFNFQPAQWLNPFNSGGWPMMGLELAVWINGLLFLANLLPAFPFDGGLILRSLLRPAVGRPSAIIYTYRVAMAIGIALLILAWSTRHALEGDAAVPISLPIAALAVFLMFSARRDRERLELTLGNAEDIALRARPAIEDIIFEEINEENAVLVEKWQSLSPLSMRNPIPRPMSTKTIGLTMSSPGSTNQASTPSAPKIDNSCGKPAFASAAGSRIARSVRIDAASGLSIPPAQPA